KAAARLRVVVVFATPPFWLVKAITFAVGVTGASGSGAGGGVAAPPFAGLRSNSPITWCLFAWSCRIPPGLSLTVCTGRAGQTTRIRHRKGGRGPHDGRRRPRSRRRPRGQADDRRGGRRAG